MSLATLLGNADAAGLFRLPAERREELADAGSLFGLRVISLSAAELNTVPELLKAIAAALEFPDWFGQNLDALMDCLTDMSWQQEDEEDGRGYLLLIAGLTGIQASDAQGLEQVFEVMAAASEVWQADGVPFWVLAEAEGLPELPESQ